MRTKMLLATACAAFFTVAGSAQTSVAPAASSGIQLDRAAAAAAFGARDRIIDASLSPDGTKVALVVPGPEQSTVLQVLDTATNVAKPINLADGKPFRMQGCNWASNARIVCTLYGISDRNSVIQTYTRTIAMDPDGNNAIPLSQKEHFQDYAQNSDGYVVDWRDGKTDKVLFARDYIPAKANTVNRALSMAQGLGVDLIDTRTAKVEHVESPDWRAVDYIGDGLGAIRILGKIEQARPGREDLGDVTYYYRVPGSRDWKLFSLYEQLEETGMRPLAVDGAANVAYALEKKDGRDALFRVKLDGSMAKEIAFADPKVDVDGVDRVGRQGRVIGARVTHETSEVEYFDPAYQALLARVRKALPRLPMVSILDSSADETKHLIYGASDVDAGRYFLFDTAARKLSPIGQARPDLSGVVLGTVKPITYKAADCTLIPAYLTLPPVGAGKGLPAIVMPHGGPASRDRWGFDWLAQFFVNRGYAVLQPNYRGSSGYGQEWFRDNGWKSWKVAIGDVNDAGRWLVAQGIADPAKLAIVGWSYGGYAALQSNVLDPALFKAVVAIAPVTDLGELKGESQGYGGHEVNKRYIGEGPHIDEGSPARHASAFRAPVLMFHGTDDLNVRIGESRLMDRRLKEAGKSSELIVYPSIDHGLRDSAVRTDMLTRADAFLTKALGR
ncbi:S9 family peptidase [soil metagenome]